MAKELVISGGPHETRVAVLEDDQLVELYFQRKNEYSLAGSIHKGRVTRVLPGMQSAFVDLGLERDTFLYVSDFFDDEEDIEKVSSASGGRGERQKSDSSSSDGGRRGRRGRDRDRGRKPREANLAPPATEDAIEAAEEAIEEAGILAAAASAADTTSEESAETTSGGRRRRRRGRNGKSGFPSSKYADPAEESAEPEAEAAEESLASSEDDEVLEEVILLPGETRKKLQSKGVEPVILPLVLDESPATEAKQEAEEEAEEEPVDSEEDTEDDSSIELVAAGDLDEEEEEEVLEEVKQHLAEIAREKEEERDFEEAAAEASDEDDEDGEDDTDEADEADEAEDADEAPEITGLEVEQSVLLEELRVEDFQPGEDSATVQPTSSEEPLPEVTPEDLEEDSSEESVVLPALGYSAHLRQNEGDKDSRERGGRRRRNRRGRDRSAETPTAEAAPEPAPERAPERTQPREERREHRSEHRSEHRASQRPAPSISDLLKEGQEVLVQIAKEPLGQKGARITSHIALPGRYCVYMPTVEHTGVSRKIGSDEERARLKRILQSRKDTIAGGFIIRTAGEGRAESEILADMEFLHNLWMDIRRKAESKPAPALIYHDLEIVERVLRDQVGPDFKSIWVDNEEIYESVLRFLERFQPAMVPRVRMYTRQAPIFDSFNITAELEKALRPKVWLKSGGYIVINQTEALVAIDINTGKFVGRGNRLEDTIAKTNIEAVKEIVRQIRLRDLGGIIVIDFIDMDERKNRVRVMQALEEAMQSDRAPYKILQFNDFGLVAITRKRVKQSLERTLCSPCPYCEGSGYVKSVATVIGEILNEAKKLVPALEDAKDVTLRVNPEVAKVFKSTDNQYHEELESILRRQVLIISDPVIHQEQFDLA